MSTLHSNDSHLNSSRYANCVDMIESDADLSISSIFLILNFVVGLPANMWVVWLICHGTREVLASEVHLLSLAVCEIFNCLTLPARLVCMYITGHVGEGLAILLDEMWILVWVGRPILQSCICMERYMAVVHPLIFIRFKPLKYKLAQCALAWCVFFLIIFFGRTLPEEANMVLIWFIPTLCTFLFCCFSVLCALQRPGPGEREGAERRRGDKIKRKAFNIILINLACFLLNYLPFLVVSYLSEEIDISGIVIQFIMHLGEVCGLVQPLLYLRRAGKLSCV